uniref:Insulin receptor n=1 Tax=virus sp. ctah610 TaxID=2826807 RepID=A0A8S5R7W3_9VIRU|nr:MAG TPA: Insulin receptor [virus sp. ctah610]
MIIDFFLSVNVYFYVLFPQLIASFIRLFLCIILIAFSSIIVYYNVNKKIKAGTAKPRQHIRNRHQSKK